MQFVLFQSSHFGLTSNSQAEVWSNTAICTWSGTYIDLLTVTGGFVACCCDRYNARAQAICTNVDYSRSRNCTGFNQTFDFGFVTCNDFGHHFGQLLFVISYTFAVLFVGSNDAFIVANKSRTGQQCFVAFIQTQSFQCQAICLFVPFSAECWTNRNREVCQFAVLDAQTIEACVQEFHSICIGIADRSNDLICGHALNVLHAVVGIGSNPASTSIATAHRGIGNHMHQFVH